VLHTQVDEGDPARHRPSIRPPRSPVHPGGPMT
jgi:hypothetical protein